MKPNSPYYGNQVEKWKDITQKLLDNYPLTSETMVKVSLSAWDDIFHSGIGKENFKIGENIFPSPQIMGFFLHELISLKLHLEYPKTWIKDREVSEKDLVYVPDVRYSMEIKTSSNPNKIFGNRSYAQPSDNPKKDKSGYYLAINFEKFSETSNPKVRLIRFGWLDHTDWIGQRAPTGQQAHLTPEANESKLLVLYRL